MKTDLYNAEAPLSFSTYLAIGSFAIGTLLFLLHVAFPREESLLFIGFFYVLFAFLFNSLALLNLGYQYISKPYERQEIAVRVMILLANLPIASLYFYLVITFK
jgi:hypothetical protein